VRGREICRSLRPQQLTQEGVQSTLLQAANLLNKLNRVREDAIAHPEVDIKDVLARHSV